jgi:hypothetical protein
MQNEFALALLLAGRDHSVIKVLHPAPHPVTTATPAPTFINSLRDE